MFESYCFISGGGGGVGELTVWCDAAVLIAVTRWELHGALGYPSNSMSYGPSIKYTQVYVMNTWCCLSYWHATGRARLYPLIRRNTLNAAALTTATELNDCMNGLTALLQELIVAKLGKKFHVFYGTRRLITTSIRARHWSISWARWIQSIPYSLFPSSLYVKDWNWIKLYPSVKIMK
jgi:hypothetical protein